MKFWELTSAFRTETENLKIVFSKDKWLKYKTQFDNINDILQRQDRQILDEDIPFQLAREVCELSRLKFYLNYTDRPLRLTSWKPNINKPIEEVSSLDILLRFGGFYIEETLERSYSEVQLRQIADNVEVLGVFDLTNIGMLAFLRNENGKLPDNQLLRSLDNLREWTVIKEAKMFLSPLSATQKQEHLKQQGIFQYIIKPINGTEKPFDTEILALKLTSDKQPAANMGLWQAPDLKGFRNKNEQPKR
jgi:hypothetical protein